MFGSSPMLTSFATSLPRCFPQVFDPLSADGFLPVASLARACGSFSYPFMYLKWVISTRLDFSTSTPSSPFALASL